MMYMLAQCNVRLSCAVSCCVVRAHLSRFPITIREWGGRIIVLLLFLVLLVVLVW